MRHIKNHKQNYFTRIVKNTKRIVPCISYDDGNVVIDDNNHPSFDKDTASFNDDGVPGTRIYWENLIKALKETIITSKESATSVQRRMRSELEVRCIRSAKCHNHYTLKRARLQAKKSKREADRAKVFSIYLERSSGQSLYSATERHCLPFVHCGIMCYKKPAFSTPF